MRIDDMTSRCVSGIVAGGCLLRPATPSNGPVRTEVIFPPHVRHFSLAGNVCREPFIPESPLFAKIFLPMHRLLRSFAFLVVAFGLSSAARAQNTVFNDSFTADGLNPATYPVPTATATGWIVASNKAAPAPVESGGTLTINMAGTTSGFVETQALFAPAAVTLLPGTYIELTATFIPTNVLTTASDNLVVGLFNSGGSAPATGLLTSGLSNSL